MPTRYTVLEKGRIVIEKIWGKVSHEELMENERKQQSDSQIADGAIMLSDLRELTLSTYNASITKEIIDLYKTSAEGMGIIRCALLVDSENWSKAKEIEKGLTESGKDIMVFHLLDVACLWLGIDENWANKTLKALLSDA